MGSLPTDPCLLLVSYLTVEVLEVASCILLTKTRKKKGVQHSTPEHSQTPPKTSLKLPSETSASALSSLTAVRTAGKCETHTRKLHANSAHYCTATLLGAVPRLSAKESICGHTRELRALKIQQEGPWAKSGWLWGWVLSHPGARYQFEYKTLDCH